MTYDYFYGKQAEQYLFYKLPKILIKEESLKKISMDAKVLYSLMLDRTARALYGMVYEDSLKYFLQGDHANFADAALRMGNVFEYGIAEQTDVIQAYEYYLEAVYAADLRAQESHFFGDEKVLENAKEALERITDLLPEDYVQEYFDFIFPYYFVLMTRDNYKCRLTRTGADDGNWELIAERLPTRSVQEPEPLLLTVPQIGYCERTLKASMVLSKNATVCFNDNTDTVKFDACVINADEDRIDFYYDDEITAWVKTDYYRVYR